MKASSKVILIVSLVLIVAGVTIAGIGYSMGGVSSYSIDLVNGIVWCND